MIVLWFFSMVLIALYTLILFKTDFSGKEGIGVIKWLVIASMLLILFTLIFMGVKLWYLN